MARLLALLFALVAALSSAAVSAGPTSFGGEALLPDAPPTRIHVQLIDTPAGVSGAFTTEDMQLEFQGKRSGSLVRGTLSAGGAVGTAEIRLNSLGADGTFKLGGEQGILNLRRTAKDAQAYLHPIQSIDLTPAQWLEDLNELVSILMTKHGGPFDHISRVSFLGKVAQARELIPGQSAVENALLFRKLAALIGDGHTEVALVDGRPRYPIELFSFEDGLRLVAAGPENKGLLGTRLVAVNGLPIQSVVNRMRRYIGQHETEWAYRSSYPSLLQRAELLHDAGVAGGGGARFTFLVAGKRRTISISAVARSEGLARYGLGAPLWQRRGNEGFWYQRWPDETFYVNWRTYDDLGAKSAALLGELDRQHPRRLLIDVRDNAGGDFKVGRSFVDELRKRPWLNKRGVLFVLLGRQTFSAGMTNSVDLKATTNATLVGEPAGASPNGWQEVRHFYLPNSGLRVSVSTKKYTFLPSKKQVDPDVLIPARLSDWTAEKDAATRYILRMH